MSSWLELPRGWQRQIDAPFIFFVFLLTFFGIIVIAGSTIEIPGFGHYWQRQTMWWCISLAAMFVAISLHPTFIATVSIPVYFINLLLLVGLLIRGKAIKGAASWYDLGPFNYQPSETMKLATVFLLAYWLSDSVGNLRMIWKIVGACLICAVPAALIFLQPDLGTALIFVPLVFGMMFLAGVKKRILILLLLLLVLSGAIIYPHLKQYQKDRLTIFLNPEKDPKGKGYNIIQAQITLGSGQITGKGWGNGTQTALRFLPEHHTDFIFASISEQFGILGCLVVLTLIGFLLYRMLILLQKCQDEYAFYVGAGCALIFISHVLYNIGMTLGFAPVSGLPLPLMSYGGTFLVVTYFGLGLIQNASFRRYMF